MTAIALTTANRVEIEESFEQMTLPAAEAITAGAPVRLTTDTGKFTNANGTTAAEARVYGIATKTVAAGMPVTAIRRGVMDGFALSALDYGVSVFLSDTDGRVDTAEGTINVSLGHVIPATSTTLGTAFDKLFRVDVQTAEDIALDSVTTGALVATTGTFSGAISATTGTFSGAVAANGGITVPTGDTVAITDASALTAGGNIVRGEIELSVPVDLHATKTEYNLFVAREALQVTHLDYVPDVAQGGALTGTIVKASGTATPVKTTTPMHAADAIDLNAAAHTVQPLTLTVTTADLQLAAGERIGLDLSAALTTGSGVISIRAKRL